MPIEARVDHGRHLVVATGTGLVQDADVFACQISVWSREDVGGYDEIFKMRGVAKIWHALARMYDVIREMEPGGTKQVSVFRTMQSALQFLGIEGPLEP